MATTHKLGLRLFGVILLLSCGTTFAQDAQQHTQTERLPAVTLVKNVIYNEMHPPSVGNIHWKYRLDKTVAGKDELRTVIETQSGSVDKLIAIGGKPLTNDQAAREQQRILNFSHSPREQSKAAEERRKDMQQCNSFLNMIPQAFVFEYAGQDANAIKLTFKPSPQFQPPSREAKVLQQMAGEMWVDARQQRLISIRGQLINEVKFGGGFLGHLEKGGQFIVKRAEVAPQDWEVTELTVNMQGKALFFKSISVQQHEVHSDFQRAPDDLSIADATTILLRPTLVASAR